MIKKRTIGAMAALGGMAGAVALLSGTPAARADELSDLRVNQELLERRVDQLAQAAAAPAGPAPVMSGSFPRSFVIPGTDTSLQIGGQAVGSVVWYMHGAATGGALNGQGSFNETYVDGQGGTGNLPGIPLNGSIAHSRSEALEFSGKQSRIFLDARTPSPWGSVRAYIAFDFAASNTNTILNVNQGSTNGYIPRLREGYAVVGPVLAGQTWGTMVDLDAAPELLDFGGQTGTGSVARTPIVRYTVPLPQYGATVAVAAENPNPYVAGPFGTFYPDSNQIPTEAACGAVITPAPTATNVTNACLGNAAFFDLAQQFIPTFVGRVRFDQPWGHVAFYATGVNYNLNDGKYINKNYEGWGVQFTGDVKPWQNVSLGLPGTWARDDITFGANWGDGIGDQSANNIGLATNFGGALNGQAINATNSTSTFTTNRVLYDRAVLGTLVWAYGAQIGYEHFWTDDLRSQVDFSMNHSEVPTALIQASGAGSVNKELDLAHVNLIWSPAPFVDTGVEGAWGHRVVQNNLRGDAFTLQTSLKVKF